MSTKNEDNSTSPNSGIKFDQGKAPMSLLPSDALEEIARVLQVGAGKYGKGNWAKGLKVQRLLDATMRHISSFNKGIDMDEETQTLHVANAACNLMFIIWMMKNRPDQDDRWEKAILTIKEANKILEEK